MFHSQSRITPNITTMYYTRTQTWSWLLWRAIRGDVQNWWARRQSPTEHFSLSSHRKERRRKKGDKEKSYLLWKDVCLLPFSPSHTYGCNQILNGPSILIRKKRGRVTRLERPVDDKRFSPLSPPLARPSFFILHSLFQKAQTSNRSEEGAHPYLLLYFAFMSLKTSKTHLPFNG